MRVRMVLEEKQIPFTIIEEDFEHFSQELIELHPEARVPLLIHERAEQERVVLYQSTVITEYLDEAFPEKSLMPKDASDRAAVRLWTYWSDGIFKPDLDLYKYELKTLNPEARADLEARLHALFTKWDEAIHLASDGQYYLVAGQFTLADVHLFPFARQFLRIAPALPGVEQYQKLHTWLSQMVARPAFERVMKKV